MTELKPKAQATNQAEGTEEPQGLPAKEQGTDKHGQTKAKPDAGEAVTTSGATVEQAGKQAPADVPVSAGTALEPNLGATDAAAPKFAADEKLDPSKPHGVVGIPHTHDGKTTEEHPTGTHE